MPAGIRLLYTCCLLWLGLYTGAQTGNPFITNYSSKAFGGSDQNFSITQDSAGRIFTANRNGVFVFDGRYWKQIWLPNEGSAISLYRSASGRIYVGGESEFGYIEQGTKGRFRYRSLCSLLPKPAVAFENIWAIKEIDTTLYFCSNQAIFCYSGHSITTCLPQGEGFHTFFVAGTHLLVREWGTGLKVMSGGGLKPVEGSASLKDVRVYAILPKSKHDYILATRNGSYLMSLNSDLSCRLTKAETDFGKWCMNSEVYCGEKINANRFVYGSVKNGLVFTDSNMTITSALNSNAGLLDNNIKSIYRDLNNNIWTGLNSGLAMCEVNSPVSFWNKQNGLNGVVEATASFNGYLYAATDKGLLRLNQAGEQFEETAVSGQVFGLDVFGDELFVASETGLYRIDKTNGTKLLHEGTIYTILCDEKQSLFYLAGDDTLMRFSYRNGQLHPETGYRIHGIVRSLCRNNDGYVAAGSETEGVFIISPANRLTQLTRENGLPGNYNNFAFEASNKLVFATDIGFFEWNAGKPDTVTSAGEFNILGRSVAIVKARHIGNSIWFVETNSGHDNITTERINRISLSDQAYHENTGYLKRIPGTGAKHFYEHNGFVYLSTNEGIYCCNEHDPELRSAFFTVLSKLWFGEDTTFMLENFSGRQCVYPYSLDHAHNQLHVLPSATNFYGNEKLEFSYYLEGKEPVYCSWRKNESIDYTDLREGTYTLYVRAKDNLGNISDPVSISFTILPPWYRTWWAYTAYAILGIYLVVLVVRLNTRRLKESNLRLENTIRERTKEISQQKLEIEHKNQEITDSINYAKGIQDSILPGIAEIKKAWHNIFIFFQPKDIVSGDFYWFRPVNADEFLVACADCTGHGVPGGFMSMICSDKLHLAARDTSEPGRILYLANNSIKESLRQQMEGKSKDGMEICLLKVNTKTREVKYAGANRPLWIYRGATGEIEEIRPTKASVASFTEFDFMYQQHEFRLDEGDTLYATSDGYPDQFGGRDGKKYMSKNLKAFLISISQLAMEAQEQVLRDNIREWMRGHEQVDDLLVLGIRL